MLCSPVLLTLLIFLNPTPLYLLPLLPHPSSSHHPNPPFPSLHLIAMLCSFLPQVSSAESQERSGKKVAHIFLKTSTLGLHRLSPPAFSLSRPLHPVPSINLFRLYLCGLVLLLCHFTQLHGLNIKSLWLTFYRWL